MSTYIVTAIDANTGITTPERVTADTEALARTSAQSRGLTVVHVKKVGLELNAELPFMKKGIKLQELAVFARMFSTMINAGMPMLRAMNVMVGQTDNPSLRAVLRDVQKDLEGGSKLSEAIGRHDTVFPPVMTSLIRAGEVGGFLDEALTSIADTMEKDVKLRRQVVSAMTYPVVVFIMAILGTIAMLIFVVPTMSSMFTDLGGELPLATRVVMALSDFMKVAAIPLAVVAVAFGSWWGKNKNKPHVREFVDPIKMKLPVFGPLVSKIAIARFARNLSVMLGSGVPLLTALQVVADTADNAVIRRTVLSAAKKVQVGGNLSEYLGEGDVIPSMVVQMVAVGEESGSTDDMLAKAAAFYDSQVEATTEQLSSLLEPLLIVFIAGVVGSMVVSMYLPTFQVMDLVQ